MSSTDHLSELESLRSQVADLTRELAARDQSMQAQNQHLEQTMQDLREQSHLLRTIIEGTAAETGDEFFASLVTHLTATLKVQYAIVGKIVGDQPKTIRTLAVSAGGTLIDNFEYALDHAPCGTGLEHPFWCFEQGVQAQFPHFPNLATLGVESHCGAALRTKTGEVIGLLIVMDTKPLRNSEQLHSLMEVFAARAAAELQRHRAEAAHRASEARLRFTQFAMDRAEDGVLWADDSRRFTYVNEAACRTLGYSKEELLTLSIPDIAPYHDPSRFQQRLDQIKQGTAATYESVHRRKDGTEFPVEASVTYLEHEGRGYTCGIVRNITERKRIERERLQALYDLQNIMETVPDFMFTLDTQGNMVKWNRRVVDVTGYSPEELLNKPALAFVPPEERTRTTAAIQQAFTEGYAELDGHLLTKDHRLIPYHWTGALLKNLHGEAIGITGIGRDVAEKKRAEEELHRQQRHLVEAQALAHLGSWSWNIESGEEVWSDEQFRIFGYEPGSISVVYETFMAALLPDDHDRVLAAINEALLGKAPYDIECRIVRPNGDVREIHCRGEVQRDTTGHPLSMACTILDITERKQIEAALRASEERWQLAVQGSNDGIWDWNIPTGDIFFSSRWKAMRGFADHEITNHVDAWRSRIHPDDLDRVLQNIDAYLAKHTPEFREEYRVQRKDGSYMWMLDRGAALWGDDGTPLRMAGSESDITERKQILLRLAQQESLLRSILDAEPECVKRVAADGTLLQMNGAGLCFIEADSFEQVAGRSVYDLVAPEFLDQFRSMHEAVVQGASQHLEFQIVGLKGTRRWMETHAVPLRNPIDHRAEHLAITRDITERKQAEGKLRLTQFTIDHAADAVYWINREAQIVDVNEAASLMLGYSKDELCAMTVHDLNPDFQSDRWPGFWAETRQRKTIAFETFHRAKTGQLIPVEISINYLSYEGQELHCAFVRNIAERKMAQEELRRSKAQLTDILENNPAVVYARQVGDGWPMTFITPNVYELLGYTSVDILCDPNRMDLLIHSDDDRDLMTRGMPQLLSKGAHTFIHRLRHRDGTYRWIENRARLTDDGKGALQLFGTMIDVTERKRTEAALEEERHRLVTAQLLAHLGSWEWNVQTGFNTWSDENYRIFGYDPGSIQPTYEVFAQAVHPEDRERVLQAAREAVEEDTPYDLEYRIVRPSGEIRHVHCRGEVTREDTGRPLHMAGTVLDITERKRTQEALAQRERQLQTVLDALPVGVWFTDQSGKPLLANPAAKQIWSGIKQVGIETAANAAGWWEAIGSSSEPHRWALSHALTKGVPSLYETLDLECLDGTRKTIRNSTVPVRDEAGVVLGAIVVNEDITALRQTQEALKLTRFSVDHAPDVFIWAGPDGRILDVNEAACRILEYTREELLASSVPDIDPNFSPGGWAAHWEEVKQKGSMTFESKQWSRTGRVLDMEITVNYLQYEEREYNCAIMRDIGERRRADAALRESEELFAKTFRSSPYPIVLSELETGCFIDANDASFELIGYRRGEIAGHTATGIGLWPNSEDRLKFVGYLKQVGSIRNLEVGLRNKAGEIRQCLVSAERVELNGKSCMITVGTDITEQKRAEEALRVSEERYRSLVDNAPIGIFVNEEGRFAYVNREMQRILNATSAEQLIGTTVLDRIAPEFHQVVKERIHELMENGQPAPSLDEQFLCLDGSRVDVAVTAIPTSFDGTPVMQVLVLDITERKKAEAALREKHALLSAIMDATMDIVFVKDIAGRYLHMNPAGARAVGIPVEEVVGKDDDAIWPADLAACCKAADRKVMTSGVAQTTEESTTVDGNRITYLTTKAPYRDTTGCMIGIIGVAHDITQIKRSEDELRQSHAFIRQIIDTDPNFIFAKDRAGRFTLVNKAVAHAYGTTVEDLIGKTDADFNANQEEVAFFRQKDLEVMDSLRDLFLPEEVITDSTGRPRWLQTVKRPILDEQGRAIMVLGAATDITERKRMEEALRQRERDLRAAIEERERISQDLHDGILQSLFAIGLTLETTKSMMSPRTRKISGPPLDQAIEQLNRVMHEVRNFIAGLGSDLLQGKDLPTALHHMLESLTQNHPTRVRLAIEERATQAVSAEQSLHLLLVIQEAVSNCIRHGHAQEANVSLKMLKQGVRLSIRDNGRGFNPNTVKGAGHGLSNMAARAQKIGGRFTVISKIDKGTRVVLDLPKEGSYVHR